MSPPTCRPTPSGAVIQGDSGANVRLCTRRRRTTRCGPWALHPLMTKGRRRHRYAAVTLKPIRLSPAQAWGATRRRLCHRELCRPRTCAGHATLPTRGVRVTTVASSSRSPRLDIRRHSDFCRNPDRIDPRHVVRGECRAGAVYWITDHAQGQWNHTGRPRDSSRWPIEDRSTR